MSPTTTVPRDSDKENKWPKTCQPNYSVSFLNKFKQQILETNHKSKEQKVVTAIALKKICYLCEQSL